METCLDLLAVQPIPSLLSQKMHFGAIFLLWCRCNAPQVLLQSGFPDAPPWALASCPVVLSPETLGVDEAIDLAHPGSVIWEAETLGSGAWGQQGIAHAVPAIAIRSSCNGISPAFDARASMATLTVRTAPRTTPSVHFPRLLFCVAHSTTRG